MKEFNGMTVGELKEALENFDEDMKVGFSYNYGDHCQTEVVVGAKESCFHEAEVDYSEYHRSFKTTDGENEDDEIILLIG